VRIEGIISRLSHSTGLVIPSSLHSCHRAKRGVASGRQSVEEARKDLSDVVSSRRRVVALAEGPAKRA
jgi:hypothetical protein